MEENSARDVAILEQRIGGASSIAIAERYGCTITEVDAALDRRLNYDLDNALRLRAIKLDVARLEALMQPFFERATKGDCDVSAVAAGTLCVKILERRALLLGLDHPVQARVDVYAVEQQQKPSSYDRIVTTLMRLKHGEDWTPPPDDGNGAVLAPPSDPSADDADPVS